jgi:two-component system cell cycle response regulator
MMPGFDGFEVCRRIRASPSVGEVPVLLFTSLSSDSDAELGRQAGATHMITKPFSLPGLGAVLKNCLARLEAVAV